MTHLIAGTDPNNDVREIAVGVNGAIDVNIQDSTSDRISLFFRTRIRCCNRT